MRVQLQFSGGAELLFDGVREHVVDLPEEQQKSGWTLQNLLPWIKNNLLKQRSELLIQEGTVRPGILVLINDTDWELMGQLSYQIQSDDVITFISTLHGG